MRNLIVVLILDGLLIVGATANQFYQNWSTRKVIHDSQLPKVDICSDTVVVAYFNEKPISTNGWLACNPNQEMIVEPFNTGSVKGRFIRCNCIEDNILDTGI